MTAGLNQLRGSIPRANEYDIKFPTVAPNPAKFNAILNQYGIRLLHEKAVPCPNFIGAIGSQQHDNSCNLCENSMLHYDGKILIGFFQTNEMIRNYMAGGFWERGSAFLTVPSYYSGDVNDQVYVSFYDRFTVLDYEDRFYEVLHKTEGDVDKLRFKALKVEFIRTTKASYEQDRHFSIDENGNIKWLTNIRPGKDLATGLGDIFVISYFCRPVYRVIDMLHEGRFSQTAFKSKTRTPLRFPQQMVVRKDFVIEKRDEDGNIMKESLYT